jgi:hypothetical protein
LIIETDVVDDVVVDLLVLGGAYKKPLDVDDEVVGFPLPNGGYDAFKPTVSSSC